MGSNMISAVLFDFGNVLYTFDYGRFFRAAASYSTLSSVQIEQVVFGGNDPVTRRYETGRMGSDEFLTLLRREARIDLPADRLRDLFTDIYTPNDPVISLALDLSQRIPIGLVSNTNEIHFESFMKHTPAVSACSAVGLSYRVGAMKPADIIFQSVLDALGCAPEDCVYIDDIAEYVTAARKAGFSAIQYLPGVDLRSSLIEMGLPARE